jgi:predicted murein hydrolase (TIGR00659 family)
MQNLVFLFSLVITLLAYLVSRWLYLRFQHPLLNVVLLSAGVVIITLLCCHISYAQYTPAKNVMTLLLGPATVSLAVPLYRKRHLLRCYFQAILLGTAAGAALSMTTVGLIARWGGLSNQLIVSLIPKSITVPFAVDISQLYGGSPVLTVTFVVATGTFVSIFGQAFLTRVGIVEPIARGLALGSVSHGQGTATALLEGQEPGSMAGLAMALSGVMTALFAPFIIPFLTH